MGVSNVNNISNKSNISYFELYKGIPGHNIEGDVHLEHYQGYFKVLHNKLLSIYLAFWGKLREVNFFSNTNKSKLVLVTVRTILSKLWIVLTVTNMSLDSFVFKKINLP